MNGGGTVWQAVLQLDQQWLAAPSLTKLCKHCFQVCPFLQFRGGDYYKPFKLAYRPNLKLLQHCKSRCYSLPLEGCSQSTVFSNRGTWTRRDLAAAQLADKSASRNKRIRARKRLNPNQIVALPHYKYGLKQQHIFSKVWCYALIGFNHCAVVTTVVPETFSKQAKRLNIWLCYAPEHLRLFGDNW